MKMILIVFFISVSSLLAQNYEWKEVGYLPSFSVDSSQTLILYRDFMVCKNQLFVSYFQRPQISTSTPERDTDAVVGVMYTSDFNNWKLSEVPSRNYNRNSFIISKFARTPVNSESLCLMAGAFDRFTSNNGGVSWKNIPLTKDSIWTRVHNSSFLNDTFGLFGSFASRPDLVLFGTTNVGASYKDFSPKDIDDLYGVYTIGIADDTTFVMWRHQVAAPNAYGLVYCLKSTDKGNTWKNLGVNIEGMMNDSTIEFGFRDIKFSEPNLGFACAVGYPKVNGVTIQKTMILRTTNKGDTWQVVDVYIDDIHPYRENNPSKIFTFGKDTIVVPYATGMVRVSYDRGNTWRKTTDSLNFDSKRNKLHTSMLYFTSALDGYGLFSNEPNFANDNLPLVVARYQRNDSTTSVVEEKYSTAWIEELYPNPTTSLFRINGYLNPQSSKTNVRLELYSVLGEKVQDFSREIEKANVSGWFVLPLDIRGLQSGMYILRFTDGKTATVRNLIVR